MILETAQLLSTAHRVLDPNNDFESMGLYKATHKNHPSNIWVRSGIDQYRWTFDHFCFLLQEYHYRYGKIHACDRLRVPLINAPWNIDFDVDWTEPPMCMPEECKINNDVVASYRKYYIDKKADFARWTKREVPTWFIKS